MSSMPQVDTMLRLVVGGSLEHLPIWCSLARTGCHCCLTWILVPRCTTEVSKAAKAAIENTIEYELFIAWQISTYYD